MVTIDLQEQVLNKLNALVVVINNKGDAEYVSRSARQILGYSPKQLLGSNWWEITRFSKEEGAQLKKKVLGMLMNKEVSVQTFEHLLKTSFGGQKWISWNVSHLSDDQLIGIGYDITEKKNNEKKLIEKTEKLSEQNKEIKDSIFYAKRIQESILQTPESMRNVFSDSFLLYKPKDIVSGDYYWFYEDERYRFAAAIDCTGHGVPGAMMSMVANSIFKEVFINKNCKNTDEILFELDAELFNAINKNSAETSSDGMDVAIVRIDKITQELTFSGAFRSIILSGKNGVTELRGSRYPIGFYSGIEKQFDVTRYQLEEGDCIYLFSDGFVDQFGGEENKKLNKFNFKELLKSIYDMPMNEQDAFLEYSFNNWKQDNDQTDDVLVIGIRV